MKEYSNANPEFSPKIQILDTMTASYADNVNAATTQLLQNTLCNREAIENLEESVGVSNIVYSTGISYHVGDLCFYQNMLYKCIKDTTGAWNAQCWQEANQIGELARLQRSVNVLLSTMASQSAAGLMSAADKKKLDGIAANANNYSLPLASSGQRGGVKTGYTENGRFYPVQLDNGERMFVYVPWDNTTYGAASQSAPGLMSAADKKKLDEVAAKANNYSHPTGAGNNHIPAGGAANQFLKWLSDGVAQWASLGAAAFKAVANNDTTTEDGFVADARRVKALRDDVNALNSALSFITKAENRNANFRGKFLGNSVNGAHIMGNHGMYGSDFGDVALGDYWIINDIIWRIWGFNCWFRYGDTPFLTNHMVIMPDDNLYKQQMNPAKTTAGGYMGSQMYKSGLNQAKQMISDAFGSYVLTRRDALSNEVTDGTVTGSAWTDSTIELPSEAMMYGGRRNSIIYDTAGFQLPLARLAPEYILPGSALTGNDSSYWLRDVASPTMFSCTGYGGRIIQHTASLEYGVRPVFCIGYE